MKRILILLLIVLISGIVSAQEIPVVPGSQGSPFGSYLNDQPPIIYDVKQEPKDVTATSDVVITAIVANDIEKTDEVTNSCTLHYSVDGGKRWTDVKMTQGTGDKEKEWTATIPKQKSKTEVIYYISAVDTAGNLTTEMPGFNTVWPPKIDEKDAKNSVLPMISALCLDANDDDKMVPKDLDLLEIALGYDDKFVYGKLRVEGKVVPGTLTPPQINAYGVGLLNPAKGEDILKGTGIIFAPALVGAEIAKQYGVNKPCFAIDARIQSTQKPIPEEEAQTDTVASGDTLYFRISRTPLGPPAPEIIKAIGVTALATSIDISQLTSGIAPYDATPYIYAYLRCHTYKVK